MKGINRLKILQDAIDRNLHPGQAAEMLGITPRHCRRLLKRYRQLGPLGMNNHSRGRVGNHLLPTSLIDQALCIIREHYRDFGPTLALENLEDLAFNIYLYRAYNLLGHIALTIMTEGGKQPPA